MNGLGKLSERAARIAELRIFGGLGMEEIATLLGVSSRTVEGDWATARLWLAREMREVAVDRRGGRERPAPPDCRGTAVSRVGVPISYLERPSAAEWRLAPPASPSVAGMVSPPAPSAADSCCISPALVLEVAAR